MKDHSVLPDTTLIASTKAGNQEAFAELVKRHHAKVYAVSLRMLKNREDAEDNVQNVLFKAYHHMDRFAGQSQFSTWLFRIAINEALMKLRRQKTERQNSYTETAKDNENGGVLPEIEDARQDHERDYMHRELAGKALQGLHPALKTTFLLHKGEGWTCRELAEALGVTVETVKSRVFRARVRSRRQLEMLAQSASVAFQS
jgi:RNA polymerase sigma-70 factor, ECF subfamily